MLLDPWVCLWRQWVRIVIQGRWASRWRCDAITDNGLMLSGNGQFRYVLWGEIKSIVGSSS